MDKLNYSLYTHCIYWTGIAYPLTPLEKGGILQRQVFFITDKNHTIMDMPIQIKTPGVHHIAVRVTDMARSKDFYIDKLGFQAVLDTPDLMIFFAGQTAIALKGPEGKTASGDQFNPFRVGLDHIALGCDDRAELERVAGALKTHGIENTGIKMDPTLQKDYIAFKDPDRIAWEFYSI